MIIVTIDVPDERTGSPHLHAEFEDLHAAHVWAKLTAISLGCDVLDILDVGDRAWRCLDCIPAPRRSLPEVRTPDVRIASRGRVLPL